MKQISIIVKNAQGTLATIAELMAERNINITDIEAETVGETGIIVMTVDQYDAALQALRDTGFDAISEESLLVKLKDEPGALARVAKRFSNAGINIRGIRIISREQGESIVAISVKRTEEAIKVIEDILVS